MAEGGRGPGRPARISRERILEAVSATTNLDTLTMRELAARLQVSHGALYRWVRNRDELFDLLSETLIDRVLHIAGPLPGSPDGTMRERWLAGLAWAMHDEFLVLPGYASHLARPHRHNPHSLDRLRGTIVRAFTATGSSTELAEQSWIIFITCTVSWLAATENPLELADARPRFELFLGSLVRGLPAREPGTSRPDPEGPRGALHRPSVS